MADERKSSPPREPLTQIELLITLDRIQRDVKGINEKMNKAEANDERFAKMEHEFRFVKWAAGIAVGAAIVAVVTGVAGKISFRIADPPPSSSSAERMGSDRVPKVEAQP